MIKSNVGVYFGYIIGKIVTSFIFFEKDSNCKIVDIPLHENKFGARHRCKDPRNMIQQPGTRRCEHRSMTCSSSQFFAIYSREKGISILRKRGKITRAQAPGKLV